MKALVAGLVVVSSVASCASPPPASPTSSAAPCAPVAAEKGRLRVRVLLDPASEAPAVSGRLVVAMTTASDVTSPFDIDVDRQQEVWKAAIDVHALPRGGAVEVDPDLLAWPRPFSQAPAGAYRVAARLTRADGRTLIGPATEQTLEPARAGTVEVRLDAAAPPPVEPKLPPGVDVVALESKLLTAFYGRPTFIEAVVSLPPNYGYGKEHGKEKTRRYAVEYFVMGFGGSVQAAAEDIVKERRALAEAKYPEMVRVYLPGNIPSGHHVFADSLNDGPRGRALVEELVPHLEKKYALLAAPRGRLLAGYSSGGWASLWLLINHPDFFGGTWSAAPDPVDFRSFTTVDVTAGSKDNFYRKRDGTPRGMLRIDGRDRLTIEDIARLERIDGGVGPLGTFEWVFSPRGPAGLPMPLYDRATGEQDPEVQRAWEKWDIHKVLETRWAALGPKLQGKLHLFAGGADTFHLDESLALLCEFLKSKKSDAVCEIVPAKTHFDLMGDPSDPQSLGWRVRHEMAAAAGVK